MLLHIHRTFKYSPRAYCVPATVMWAGDIVVLKADLLLPSQSFVRSGGGSRLQSHHHTNAMKTASGLKCLGESNLVWGSFPERAMPKLNPKDEQNLIKKRRGKHSTQREQHVQSSMARKKDDLCERQRPEQHWRDGAAPGDFRRNSGKILGII